MPTEDATPCAGLRHALAIPFPAQGHMNPLMRLCKTLARHHGFTITFVNIDPMQQRIDERLGESGVATSTSPPSSQNIRVTSIPMPTMPAEAKDGFRFSLADFMQSVRLGLYQSLEDLIHTLSSDGPPITCLISDVFVSTSTQKIADKLKLPRIVFFPSSQAMHLLLTHMSTGLFPLDEAIHAAQQAANRPHEAITKDLPGLPRLLYRDLFGCKHIHDETDEITRNLCEEVGIAAADKHGLNTIVVNSFLELEGLAFQAQDRTSTLPHVYPIGPLLEDLSSDEATNPSLLKEDASCLSWLDTKAPHSVLYISFGSITLHSKAQFEEFLLGLEASSQSFLLVFRRDLVDDPSYTAVPEGFLARTRGLGYVATWAPQLCVLSHPSVGGFLTHCGWNSTMEAIANGVPMLCWPYLGDQFLDAKYIVEEWKLGLRVEASHPGDSFIKRNEIEQLIRSLMQSSRGEAMRVKAMHLSSIAKECHLPTGSSYKNIQAIIKSLPNTFH